MSKKFIIALLGCATFMSCSEEKNKWEKPKDEPIFVAISSKDPDFEAAYAQSKKTFPQFLAAIHTSAYAASTGVTNGVKLKLRDNQLSQKLGEDRFFYLWIFDVQEEGDHFTAEIRELPKSPINDLTIGQRLPFKAEDIYDWMIIRDEHLWGGLTMRLVRNKQSEEQKRNYDEYSGISVYETGMP